MVRMESFRLKKDWPPAERGVCVKLQKHLGAAAPPGGGNLIWSFKCLIEYKEWTIRNHCLLIMKMKT